MPIATPLESCRLLVLAERLLLDESALAEERTKPFLVRRLLHHFPYLGDRSASELVEQTIEHHSALSGLRELGHRLLVVREGQFRLAADPDLRDVRRLLDEDLLLATRLATASQDSICRLHVDPDLLVGFVPAPNLPADLAAIINRQVAETHLHLWGAVTPIFVWLPAMLGLVTTTKLARAAVSAEVHDRIALEATDGQIELWATRLLEAVQLRWWLAAAIRELAPPSVAHPFSRVAGLPPSSEIEAPLKPRLRADRRVLADLQRDVRILLSRIGYRRSSDEEHPDLPGCPIWLNPGGTFPYRDPLCQAVEADLRLSRPTDCLPCGERYLLASSLLVLDNLDRGRIRAVSSDQFAARFLAYVRVKGAFFRLLSHQRGSRGLDRFVHQFERRRPATKLIRGRIGPALPLLPIPAQNRSAELWWLALERFQTRLAVLHWLRSTTNLPLTATASSLSQHNPVQAVIGLLEGQRRRLARKLEIRVSPSPGRLMLQALWARLRGLRDGVDAIQMLSSAADSRVDREPEPLPASSLHFQAGFIFHLQKAAGTLPSCHFQLTRKLLTLVRHRPELRPVILGLDAAGRELEAFPANFAPAFREVLKDHSVAYPSGSRYSTRFGRTFHVGEDFRDLFTGLRQIDLAVELLSLQAGDRLGHALALGIEPSTWYADHPTTLPLLGEHLADLAWASQLLSEGGHDEGEEARQLIELRAGELGARRTEDLRQTFHEWLPPKGRPIPPDSPAADERVLHRKLVRLIGKHDSAASSVIDFRPSPAWHSLLRSLQDIAIRRVERAGVVIEANPTSNVLIAGLRSFEDHPVFRLQPPRPSSDGRTPPTRVTISTDDPGMFQVSLPEEFGALFTAALRRDDSIDRSQVIHWLDRLRAEGYDSSFMIGPAADLHRFRTYLSTLLVGRVSGCKKPRIGGW